MDAKKFEKSKVVVFIVVLVFINSFSAIQEGKLEGGVAWILSIQYIVSTIELRRAGLLLKEIICSGE